MGPRKDVLFGVMKLKVDICNIFDVNKDWTCKDKDKDKDQAYKDQDKDKD